MKRYIMVLLLSIVSFFFVGCEEKSQTKVDPENNPNIPMTFNIWTDGHKNFLEALGREFFSEIQRQNIRIKVIEFKDNEQLEKLLERSMAEGYGPDVIYTTGDWVAGNYGKLLSRDGDETFLPKDFLSLFVRSANETLLQTGKIYGVPMGIDSLALYYNEEHILDRLPARNIPGKTWKAIQEDVSTLTKKDNSLMRFASSGLAIGRVDNVLYSFDIFENMMIQFGSSFFTEDLREGNFFRKQGTVNGRPVSLGVEAMNLFTSFADNRFKQYTWNKFLSNSETKYKNFETFAKGDVSMVFGYSGDMEIIKKVIKNQKKGRGKTISEKNIRVTFFPQVEDPGLGGTRKVLAKVYALAVPKTTDKPKLAWNFLKFAIRKENLKSFFDETKLPSPRVDMLKEQELDPFVGIFVRQAKYARTNIFPFFVSREFIINGFEHIVSSANEKTGTSITKEMQQFEIEVSQLMRNYIKLLTEVIPQEKEVKK
jgi:ABC-type glycerol-3-phosphate transport system substrate-binding protein